MSDDRPRYQNMFLNDRTRTILWVEWQRRRRHHEYGPAVDSCLQEMPTHLSTLSFSTSLEDQERAHTVQFLKTLNKLVQQQSDSPGEQRDRYTENQISALLRPLCQPELRTLFPPLAQFAHAWGIRLPLDPAILTLPDWVAASVFPRNYDITLTYKMVYEDLNLWPQNDRELVVEFRIRDGASHDELREQFDAILARHTHWNRARTYRHCEDKSYYEKVFYAYDLHQQGHTLPSIAQQLWPGDWDTQSHKTVTQRARSYRNRAHDLIYGEQK